jgi:hypothetical protein
MNTVMKTLVLSGVLAGVVGMEAQASAITYVLDQSNNSSRPDGVPYLTVKIEDGLTFGSDVGGAVKFTVDVINTAFPGSTVAIKEFGFNLTSGTLASSNIPTAGLPSNWTKNISLNNNPFDGFGKFDVSISVPNGNPNNNSRDPLVFWITGVNGDNVASYAAASANTAAQGNAWFAVQLTGAGGYFGGGNGVTPPQQIGAVPVPAALWLFGSAIAGMVSMVRRKNA